LINISIIFQNYIYTIFVKLIDIIRIIYLNNILIFLKICKKNIQFIFEKYLKNYKKFNFLQNLLNIYFINLKLNFSDLL